MPDQDSRGSGSSHRDRLPQEIDLSEVQNASVRKGLSLWTAKKGERKMAARDDLAPRDMADFLRNIVLVRVLDGGREFEFRIVGDAMVVIQGASFQGMNTGEIEQALPGYGSMLRSVYKCLCLRRAPMAFRGNSTGSPTGKPFFHESLLLPLGADGETVDHILVIGVYSFGEGGKEA
ncbi:MAG: PAS domain-containing protein [Rhizomicrobium sp.]|jgi:hypothetical protein